MILNDCGDCAGYIEGASEWDRCGNGNPTLGWFSLPGPGSVFLPVYMLGTTSFQMEVCVEEFILPTGDCPSTSPCEIGTLSISRADEDIQLSWSPVAGALDYEVLGSFTDGYGGFTQLAASTFGTTSWVDEGAVPNGQRFYKVLAICPEGDFVLEQEPICGDTNGGCGGQELMLEPLNEGELLCGTTWVLGSERDTDYFEIVLPEHSSVTITLYPGEVVPMSVGLFAVGARDGYGPCWYAVNHAEFEALPGSGSASITTDCLPAQLDHNFDSYVLAVTPSPSLGFSLPCSEDAPLTYAVSYTTESCDDPYPDCTGPGTWEEAIQIDSLPFTWQGSTVGCANSMPLSDRTSLICSWEGYYDERSIAGENWYRLSLTQPTQLVIETCLAHDGNFFDTVLGVFPDTGIPPQPNEMIWGNDDRVTDQDWFCWASSELEGCTLPAGDYLIVVSGWYQSEGSYELTVRDQQDPDSYAEHTLYSGNGAFGSLDNLVHVLPGPVNSPFPAEFSPAQFDSARLTQALIIEAEPIWQYTLYGRQEASWVSTSPAGNSGLYAVEFTLDDANIDWAELELSYVVDNQLGQAPFEGLYLNGFPVPGTIGGSYDTQLRFARDVSDMVLPGSNWLYLNVADQGGNSGVCFEARLSVAKSGEAIRLRSGNADFNTLDPGITCLLGDAEIPFQNPFAPADFLSAQSGDRPVVIQNHWAWIPHLSTDLQARWVSPNNQSGLLAMSFVVTTPAIGAAQLDLSYAVDNLLGSGPNEGVFVNGISIPGSSGSGFDQETQLSLDISSALVPGVNWLYLNLGDEGYISGILFSATVRVWEATP